MSEVNATHTKNTEKACWAEERRLLPTSQAEEEEVHIIRCFIREAGYQNVHITYFFPFNCSFCVILFLPF